MSVAARRVFERLPPSAVRFEAVAGMGLGLVAARDVEAGEVLLRAPRVRAPVGGNPVQAALQMRRGLLASADPLAAAYAEFLAECDAQLDLPLVWPEARVRELAPSSISFRVASMRRATGGGAAAPAVGTVLSRAVAHGGELELIPGFDLLNHGAGAPSCTHRVCPQTDWAEVVAARPHAAGEQLLIRYSDRLTDAEWLHKYGFVPEGENAANGVDLRGVLSSSAEGFAEAVLRLRVTRAEPVAHVLPLARLLVGGGGAALDEPLPDAALEAAAAQLLREALERKLGAYSAAAPSSDERVARVLAGERELVELALSRLA